MLNKVSQQIQRCRFSFSNRLPNRRARRYLINYLRAVRLSVQAKDALEVHKLGFKRKNKLRGVTQGRKVYSSAHVRFALGMLRWKIAWGYCGEDRIAHRASCFLTARGRGTSQRFTVARTRLKSFSDAGRLFGLRKSSW